MTWDLPPELLGQPPAPVREPPPYAAYDTPGRWTLYSRPTVPQDEPDEVLIMTADGRVVRRFQPSEHLHHVTREYQRIYPTERDFWSEALRHEADRITAEARAMQTKPPMPPGDDPRAGRLQPPIWHDDGSVTLWHPESPGVRVRLYHPRLWRRTLRRRHPFATTAELVRHRRTIRSTHAALAYVVECKVCGDSTRWRAFYLTKRWRVLHTHLTGHASYAVDGPDVIQVPPTPPRGPGGGSPRIPTTRGFRA